MNTPANNNTENTTSQITANNGLILTRTDASLIDLMNELPYMSDLREEVRRWFLAYVSYKEFENQGDSCEQFDVLDGFFSAIILKAAKQQLAQKGGQTNE